MTSQGNCSSSCDRMTATKTKDPCEAGTSITKNHQSGSTKMVHFNDWIIMSSLIILVCAALVSHGLSEQSTHTSIPHSSQDQLHCFKNESSLFRILHGNHSDALRMDQAFLSVTSLVTGTFTICIQYEVCRNCSLLEVTELHKGDTKNIIMNSNFPLYYRVAKTHNTSEIICRDTIKMDEHGNYSLYVNPEVVNGTQCNFVTNMQPKDNRIPIYIAIGVYGGIFLIYFIIMWIYNKGLCRRIPIGTQSERLVNSDLGIPSDNIVVEDPSNVHRIIISPVRTRLRSLDTFRGLSLVIMIFVNYAGGGYWFFHHSAWDGLTVADLVFPWFVFIMGTSIALAFQSQLKKGIQRKKIFGKIVRRTIILFALGLIVSNRAKKGREVILSSLRIPGVLQRLALTYFVVALLEVIFAKVIDKQQIINRWWAGISDVVLYWPEWIIATLILAAYVLLTLFLPVPGCPSGYIGPGGLHDNSAYPNCTGGAAGYIDRMLFGSSHIYQHPTSKVPYLSTQPYDPEGTLAILSSVFLCFLGLQAGKILLLHDDWKRRTKRWLFWCVITGVVAGALCQFRQHGGVIPLNKNLWSVSFILAMASMAFFLLTICYLLVDVTEVWTGAPFLYPGMNSIVIYMAHEVLSIYFPIQFKVADTHAAQLFMALWGATLWTLVAAVLYYKKIFIAI